MRFNVDIPPVTKWLLIITVAIYFLSRLLPVMYEHFALFYFAYPHFKPYQLVTYIFMHANGWHIFMNMFGLFMFGRAVEQAWGPKRFLNYYLLTGIGAALTQFVIYYLQGDDVLHPPVVGASGALFGILLAFGMMFPNVELMMIFLPIPIKAKYFVAIYGGIELMSGLRNNADDNVAHFAHLGGMFFGFILMMIWRKNRRY